MASDGDNRFELFVWPEIFEKKAALLQENQLIYAILQMTKTDDTIKLQCRWVEDLNKIDKTVLEECERVYNQCQEQQSRKKVMMKSMPSVLKNELIIEIDANLVTLNKILTLKETLQKYPGLTKINLSFISNNKKIGTVSLGARLGITFSDNLEKSLKEITGIIAIKTV
jgi:DNA polymerase-3 subunit alpha